MSIWEERAARNEALFREVNERIEPLQQSGVTGDFICECADDTCTTFVTMTLERYERVRSDPLHFVVRRGHEKPQLEDVIEEEADFLIVRKKTRAGARIAEESDPR